MYWRLLCVYNQNHVTIDFTIALVIYVTFAMIIIL